MAPLKISKCRRRSNNYSHHLVHVFTTIKNNQQQQLFDENKGPGSLFVATIVSAMSTLYNNDISSSGVTIKTTTIRQNMSKKEKHNCMSVRATDMQLFFSLVIESSNDLHLLLLWCMAKRFIRLHFRKHGVGFSEAVGKSPWWIDKFLSRQHHEPINWGVVAAVELGLMSGCHGGGDCHMLGQSKPDLIY